MRNLPSYVCSEWKTGKDKLRFLFNPTTEQKIAETSSFGIDMSQVLSHARLVGGPALRELTFAERGSILKTLAKTIHEHREELIALAIENGGNTRSDAKFDIDGASFTLSHYGDLGESLGAKKILVDGDMIQVGRTARLSAQHILTPKNGVAVHINAFNFPAWGTAEKMATCLLAGMPMITKPATATALVAHRMMEIFVEKSILPNGACSMICGSPQNLLSLLTGQDVVAFTGSSQTAQTIRSEPAIIGQSVSLNVEADSLNSAILLPDVSLTSETGRLFVAEVAKDMTQKTGQKCTAIRRILVPSDMVDEAAEAIGERLSEIKIGSPGDKEIRMGPLATETQFKDVKKRLGALMECTEEGYGGNGDVKPLGVDNGKGYFLGPVLRKAKDTFACTFMHKEEIFGPVATVAGYSGKTDDAVKAIRLGQGGLVSTLYSDDKESILAMVSGMAPYHGRVVIGSEKTAAQSPGPGTVLPTLLHGGPGRAGGGEELGGLRGMKLYQQRTAIQGDKRFLSDLCS